MTPSMLIRAVKPSRPLSILEETQVPTSHMKPWSDTTMKDRRRSVRSREMSHVTLKMSRGP